MKARDLGSGFWEILKGTTQLSSHEQWILQVKTFLVDKVFKSEYVPLYLLICIVAITTQEKATIDTFYSFHWKCDKPALTWRLII